MNKENKTQLQEIVTLMSEFVKQDGNHVNVCYNPEHCLLQIGGGSNKPAGWKVLKVIECNPEFVALLFGAIIQDTAFITSNTEKVANVYIEYGNFR